MGSLVTQAFVSKSLLYGVGSIHSGSFIGVQLFLGAVHEKLFKNGWVDFGDGYGPCGMLDH